ncbi:MAG: magnesium transporter [Candidatus Cloacimonetes bacterium]|nr:magnesium transporter [Candidatus Cloacimonadota bacterium]
MVNLLYDQLIEYIENNQFELLQEVLRDKHPADVAEFINQIPPEYHPRVFSLLDNEMASDVLAEIHDEFRSLIIQSIRRDRLISIIDEMETDEAADLLAELTESVTKNVLDRMEEVDRTTFRQLMSYSEDSAGGIMQTEIIAVKQYFKRNQVIEYIRKNYEEVENIHYVYVVDNQNHLMGVLDIGKILLAGSLTVVSEIMTEVIAAAVVDMDQEKVASLFRKYDLLALPVVDIENHLLGRITVDDILDVIEEEATEDAYRMVGLNEEDRVFTKPINSVRKRLPWLTLNLFTAILISSVVGIFEETIAKMSFLAVLMPIVAGLGGNSGTQTLTVITRGIALGELTIHNTWQAVTKEITVGLINGIIIGSITCLIAYLVKGDPRLGFVLAVAMICNMFIAGLVGSLIPVILKSLKIDPALASSVIITMLTDIGGYISFLGLASILLV